MDDTTDEYPNELSRVVRVRLVTKHRRECTGQTKFSVETASQDQGECSYCGPVKVIAATLED